MRACLNALLHAIPNVSQRSLQHNKGRFYTRDVMRGHRTILPVHRVVTAKIQHTLEKRTVGCLGVTQVNGITRSDVGTSQARQLCVAEVGQREGRKTRILRSHR